jgi:hypothetical protein
VAGRIITASMFQADNSREAASLCEPRGLGAGVSIWMLPRQVDTISRRSANGSPIPPSKPAIRGTGPVCVNMFASTSTSGDGTFPVSQDATLCGPHFGRVVAREKGGVGILSKCLTWQVQDTPTDRCPKVRKNSSVKVRGNIPGQLPHFDTRRLPPRRQCYTSTRLQPFKSQHQRYLSVSTDLRVPEFFASFSSPGTPPTKHGHPPATLLETGP